MLTSVVPPILDSSSTEHGCLTHLSQSSPLHSMRSVPLFQLGLLCIFLKRFRRFLFRWPFKDYRSLVCYDFILDLGQWTEHESRPKPDLMCHHPSIQSISGWKLHHKNSVFSSPIVGKCGHWLWGQTADQDYWVFTFQIMFVILIISVLTVIESNKRRLTWCVAVPSQRNHLGKPRSIKEWVISKSKTVIEICKILNLWNQWIFPALLKNK